MEDRPFTMPTGDGSDSRPPSWPPVSPTRSVSPPTPPSIKRPDRRFRILSNWWGQIAFLGCVLFLSLATLGRLLEPDPPTPEQVAAEEARLAKVNALAEANQAQLALDEERWKAEREEREAVEAARPQMNATNFGRIREGMTYEEVVAIVGEPSQLLSSSQIGDIQIKMYQWNAGIVANANAMFQDGKMISKAQFGL
jgi:hypothetical protein